MEASKPLYIAGGNVKSSVNMENSLTVPQKVNNYNIMTQQLQFWVYIQKNEKRYLVLQSTHTHTHTHTYSINNSQNRKAVQFPSMNEWINKLLCIHATEYYALVKRNEAQRYGSTWKTSEIFRPSEKSKTQNVTYCVILFIGNIQNK